MCLVCDLTEASRSLPPDAFTKGANFDLIFVPTQIWLWTSSIVDIMITSSLIYHLAKMKQGFNESCVVPLFEGARTWVMLTQYMVSAIPRTDMFLDSLIRLSFETCLAPSFFSVLSAILYAVFVNTDYLWNVGAASQCALYTMIDLSYPALQMFIATSGQSRLSLG